MIKIVTDSTADLPDDLVREHGIVVVPVLAQFGRETLRDGVDITKDQFYARLVASDEPPKTAAPSVGMFEEAFRAAAADGSEILSISLVANLSGTFNAARQAAYNGKAQRTQIATQRARDLEAVRTCAAGTHNRHRR